MIALLEYLAGRTSPEFIPGDGKRAVVIVHGLLHRAVMMRKAAKTLHRLRPDDIYLYDYRTTRKGIYEHGNDFASFLADLNKIYPEIAIITHSMGGLVTRVALQQPQAAAKVKTVVMIAPPNHGSAVAARWVEKFAPAPWLVKPLPDLSDHPESIVHRLPGISGAHLGIITMRHDRKVAMDSSWLDGAAAQLIMDGRHCRVLFDPEVIKAADFFINNGFFTKKICKADKNDYISIKGESSK